MTSGPEGSCLRADLNLLQLDQREPTRAHKAAVRKEERHQKAAVSSEVEEANWEM